MQELNDIVSNSKYTTMQIERLDYTDRIETNKGVFFSDDDITTKIYNQITHMKVYGSFINKHEFQNFTNLEVLDVSSMDCIEKSGWNTIIPTRKLLKLNMLTKLQILKIIFIPIYGCMDNNMLIVDYSFLNFLPTNITHLIILGLSNSSVDELNFSNIPSTTTRIEIFKRPVETSKKFITLLNNKLKSYTYPFGCEIYLDNVILDI